MHGANVHHSFVLFNISALWYYGNRNVADRPVGNDSELVRSYHTLIGVWGR